MKHIFILQGKKFISSKRASQISGYSSDYIGQLCRAGKLDCMRVGHGWFVTQESLMSRMSSSVASESKMTVQPIDHTELGRISTKQASEISGYTSDYIGQLCRSGKLDARRFGTSWLITESSLRSHMEHIERSKAADHATAGTDQDIVVPIRKQILSSRVQPRARARTSSLVRRLFFFGSITTVILCAICFSVVPNDFSLEANPVHQLAQVASLTSSASAPVTHQAVVAVPGSTPEKRGQVIADIQNSFSDPVTVTPDTNGTTGVITPVFRNSKSKDYLYVMLPISGSRAPP